MVLLPGCKCCKSCSSDDSDGYGTFFETDLKTDGSQPNKPTEWINDGVAFTPAGADFATGYAARCTSIDLSKDSMIEIEMTAAECGGTFLMFVEPVAYVSSPAGSPVQTGIACQHNPKFGDSFWNGTDWDTYDGVYLRDRPDIPFLDNSTYTFGFYNLTYRCAFKFVGGLWSASFAINGTNIFTDTPCPYMTLADSRFYHGFSGTPVGNITDRKRLTRYYMKLTYL